MDLQLLAHRGPDGSGEWNAPDGHCWFGHTRLAILDLSSLGAQPMRDEKTGNVIIFNGEIYNHEAIREALGSHKSEWKGEATRKRCSLRIDNGIWRCFRASRGCLPS